MLQINNLIIKNFMSIGEIPQRVDFANISVCLILGENLDMIMDNQSIARNGAGKSAILNALSFVLFGQAISTIKRDNLINNINQKGMVVSCEFSCNGHKYRVERGRKPNFFKFIIDNKEVEQKEVDEAQGENKETQKELERVIGMSHNLFKHIIALNTATEPFLKMPNAKQRELIEELLGMKVLSEKAEILKDLLKVTKEEIKMEEFKIKTLTESNKKIENSILDTNTKKEQWDKNFNQNIKDIENTLTQLQHINIEEELNGHNNINIINSINKEIEGFEKDKRVLEREKKFINDNIETNALKLEKIEENKCPTCEQSVHSEKQEKILSELTEIINKNIIKVDDIEIKITNIDDFLKKSYEKFNSLDKKINPKTYKDEVNLFYNTIEEVYEHKSSVEIVKNELKNIRNQKNPYDEQIDNLVNNGLQDVNFDVLNDLKKIHDHQEFLLKLLTSNDSFVRKKIIDQNIAFINERLKMYLDKLGLPHIVLFESNLEVSIKNFGQDMDFYNLSRGEQTRLILALSFSFRDIFEMLTHPVNILMVDELLDSGADGQLVDGALSVLRNMNFERNKQIFIISHKEEILSKTNTILKVVKDGGFSTLELVME